MPPKSTTRAKLPDVKARKLTDFWGRSDDGSSPQASLQTTSQRTPTSSPLRKTASNTSASASKPRQGSGLFSGSRQMGNLTSRGGLNILNNDLQPTPSPRKFIVISDDEGQPETLPKMSVSKKRPREAVPHSPPALNSLSGTSQSTPELPSVVAIDLTHSPPKKKRIIEETVNAGHSRTASTLSGYSSHQEFSPITPMSPLESHLGSIDAAIALNSASTSMASFTHQPTGLFSSTNSSVESNLPSSSFVQSLEQQPEDKARSRIEEIRRLAEKKRLAERVQTKMVIRPIVLDDSDEEEDLLEKLAPTKKVQPPLTPEKPKAPSNLFDSKSPLTDPDSDSDSIEDLPIHPKVTTRSQSRAASLAPVPPPPPTKSRASSKAPTRPPPAGSKSRASSKPPIPAPPPVRPKKAPTKVVPVRSIIPSSLASLLVDSPSSNRRRDDPETLKLMRDVQRDMEEIDQRRLYGSGPAPDSLEDSRYIDPSVTEMALGEEDGRKMNEVIAMDNTTALQVLPWRPFWDEHLVGAAEMAMDVEYQTPRLSLSNNIHPILAHLQSLAANKDCTHLAAFFSSGILQLVPSSDEDKRLIPWLFKLGCESPDYLAIPAQQSLHARLSRVTNPFAATPCLEFGHLMDVILSLGPLAEAIAPLKRPDVAISAPRDPMSRNVVLARSLSIIKRIRYGTAMVTQSPEHVFVLLLLLYLDPSTPTDLRRDISLIIEDIILSFAVGPVGSENHELLVICKKVIQVTANFRLSEKRMLLECIFGGQPAPRRFMRWIAVGFLLPDIVTDLDWAGYLQPPLLGLFADMLTPYQMATSPFRISSKTDYHDLHHRIDMLGTILTDIELYGSKEDSNIEQIMAGLDHAHSKIVDARAAFIERTRAKDALQRLRLRVYFQFQKPTATIEAMLKR